MLICRYLQFVISKEYRDRSGFTFHHALIRLTCMTFRVLNTPGKFQGPMDVLQTNVRWKFAFVFLDDIVLFSQTGDMHIDQVQKLLMILHDTDVTLNSMK